MRTPFLLVWTLLSCSEHSDSEEALTDRIAETAAHVTDLRTMEASHASAVEDAADLDAVLAIETQHESEMAGHLDHLGEGLDGVGACTDDGGHGPDTTRMHQVHEDCMSEGDGHLAAMKAAADFSAALEEEGRHQAAVTDLLDDLDADLDALDEMADAFHCGDSAGQGH
jgi:hypothetical protein